MIKHIIFDWGNVLEPDSNLEGSKILAKKYNVNMIELYNELVRLEPFYSTGEEGEQFFEHFQNKYNIPKEELQEALNTPEYKKNMRRLLEQLHKKFKLYVLSNQMSYRTTYIKKHEDIHFFEKLFFSSEIMFIKPDARSYQHVLREIDAKPEECIFIDDVEANVDGARKLGIDGILFINIPKLIEDLNERGIEVN